MMRILLTPLSEIFIPLCSANPAGNSCVKILWSQRHFVLRVPMEVSRKKKIKMKGHWLALQRLGNWKNKKAGSTGEPAPPLREKYKSSLAGCQVSR
jgi:hypothetical protein